MKIKTCVPEKLPLRSLAWESFVPLLGEAHEILGRIDERIQKILHPKETFSLLISQEALHSLESQKVLVTLEELLEKEAFGEKSLDSNGTLQRIFQYRKAMIRMLKSPHSLQISSKFLCQLHGMIKSQRKKSFRTQQNWIGPIGKGIEEAYFYPPNVPMLHKGWQNLKQYLQYKERDPLVQLAIFFAQLLVLHPFMDGNGRVARMLIPFFLYKKKLLSKPLFFISRYFQEHRSEYFERLFAITTKRDWEGWIHFFLQGIILEGKRMEEKMEEILSLYYQLLEEIGSSKEAKKKLADLFSFPILKKEEWKKLKRSYRPLKILEEKNEVILHKKEAMVAVRRLLAIAKKTN